MSDTALKNSDGHRRRVRRTAAMLFVVAAAFYLGFIAMSLSVGHP